MNTSPTAVRPSRRRILKTAAATTAVLSARGWSSLIHGESPADRLRIGVIGTGVRGKYLIGNLPESVRVEAICDCATTRMAETLEPKGLFVDVLAHFCKRDAATCRTYQDYRRMLDHQPLDAVIIATPDHHHSQAAILALHAGLDVYLEKPLAVTIREGRLIADAVKASGRILQVGSQQRTMEFNRFACEFIREGGLGPVSHIDFPNYPGPLDDPGYPAEPIPAGMNWELFLGPAPLRPHNRKLWVKDEFNVGELLWRGWDLFSDYSGHLMTNWGAHSIDMVQSALGMDASGPIKITPADVSESALEQDWLDHWHNKTPRPDGSWSQATRFRPVVLEYASGTKLNLRPGIKAATFHGTRGTLVMQRNQFQTDPPDLVGTGPDPQLAEIWKGDGHVARPHLENWLDCVRTRGDVNAPVEAGQRTITVCHLVNIARDLGRPLSWNPGQETFVEDAQANQHLERPRRAGFELPTAPSAGSTNS